MTHLQFRRSAASYFFSFNRKITKDNFKKILLGINDVFESNFIVTTRKTKTRENKAL